MMAKAKAIVTTVVLACVCAIPIGRAADNVAPGKDPSEGLVFVIGCAAMDLGIVGVSPHAIPIESIEPGSAHAGFSVRDGSITRRPGEDRKPNWVNVKGCRYEYSLTKDRSKLLIAVGVEGFGEKKLDLEVRRGAAAVALFPEDKPQAVFYFAVVKPEEPHGGAGKD